MRSTPALQIRLELNISLKFNIRARSAACHEVMMASPVRASVRWEAK